MGRLAGLKSRGELRKRLFRSGWGGCGRKFSQVHQLILSKPFQSDEGKLTFCTAWVTIPPRRLHRAIPERPCPGHPHRPPSFVCLDVIPSLKVGRTRSSPVQNRSRNHHSRGDSFMAASRRILIRGLPEHKFCLVLEGEM